MVFWTKKPSTFIRGDIVRLKSGGPPMTVTSVWKNIVDCEWFDRNGQIHRHQLDQDALIPAESEAFFGEDCDE